jgi:hypothetical protein
MRRSSSNRGWWWREGEWGVQWQWSIRWSSYRESIEWWLWCCHLWKVRNRDWLQYGGMGSARRHMVSRSDMLWAFKNTLLAFLGP